MSSRARHPILLASLIGVGICVALAYASTFAPPAFITSIPSNDPGAHQPAPTSSVTAPPETLPPILDRPQTGEADLSGGLTILATVAAIAVAIVLILAAVRAARSMAARPAADPIDVVAEATAVDAHDLQDVLRRAREQIMLDDDANRAVILCWESLEALGARAGVERGDSQTAAEYVVGMLAAFDLPTDAATRLSQLYARALFSADRLSPEAVFEARSCLEQLDAALATQTRRRAKEAP